MQQDKTGWNRRDILSGAALFALVIGVPVATVRLSDLDGEEQLTDAQRNLAAEVADLVIPRSDTPGARDVGVGDFVILALAHGLAGTRVPLDEKARTPAIAPFLRQDGSIRHLYWLEQTLNSRANNNFLKQPPVQRSQILAEIDSAAMARSAHWSPWVAIKGLILTGYYTSEAGSSKELRYELVPGRYDPDIPLALGDRAWSSDWTAVDFG